MCHPSRGEINPKTWFWASITTCKFTLYYSAKSDYCPFWTFECKMWLFLSHLRNLFNGGKSGTWKVWYSSHVRFSEVDKRCNQGCQKDGHCLFCRHWLKSFAKTILSVKLWKKATLSLLIFPMFSNRQPMIENRLRYLHSNWLKLT